MYDSYKSGLNGEPQREVLGLPFASNRQPMLIRDRGTHMFLDVNAAALQQYGYSREQFLTMSTFDLRSENQPGWGRKTSDPRLQAQRTAEKYIHQGKNGNVFPVAITSWHQFTLDGHPAELILARREDHSKPALLRGQHRVPTSSSAISHIIS
jgi:PAS domain S-box-containing protein